MMDLLRFSTAGSVDDGKSTLIGRLLYDTNSIAKDQIEAVLTVSKSNGKDSLDLALLTDGLKAEREQGITIDVSYKFFNSQKRKYIISDCPGHIEYTRNLVTGASETELMIILIDARKGVLEQTRRHYFIAKMMGITKFLVCVNKMDLVDNSEIVFDELKNSFINLLDNKGVELSFIPTSALNGDNIVSESSTMLWYKGPTVYGYLESLIIENKELNDFRFPVQYVIREQSENNNGFRGFAGRVESGKVSVGESLTIYPSGTTSNVREIHVFNKKVDSLQFNHFGTILLDDNVDVSRGNVLIKSEEKVELKSEVSVQACWMSSNSFVRKNYLFKIGTSETRCKINDINEALNIENLNFESSSINNLVEQNQIFKAKIKLAKPLLIDRFDEIKRNGCFVLIDEQSNLTVAAGIII